MLEPEPPVVDADVAAVRQAWRAMPSATQADLREICAVPLAVVERGQIDEQGEPGVLWAQIARRLHRRPGESEAVVDALLRAVPLGEAWAEEALLDAACRAWEAHDSCRALTLAERGLAEASGDVDRWARLRVLQVSGLLASSAEHGPAEGERAVRALEGAGRWREAIEVRMAIVEHAKMRWQVDVVTRHAAAMAAGLTSRDHAEEPTSWRVGALLCYLAATYLCPDPAPTERLAVIDAAADLLRSRVPSAWSVQAYAAAAFAEAGRHEDADGLIDRLRHVIPSAPRAQLADLGLVGVAAVHTERFEVAREVFAAISATDPASELAANAQAWLLLLDAWEGEVEGVRERAAVLRERVWPVLVGVVHAALVEVALVAGTETELRALSESEPIGMPPGIATATWWVASARAALALGGFDRAQSCLEQAACAYRGGTVWSAPRDLTEVEAALRRQAVPPSPRRVEGRSTQLVRRALTGEVEADEVDDLPRARGWQVRLAMGTRLRHRAQTERARELLRTLAIDAETAGASRIAELALAELRLAGGRRRDRDRFGLTPAEQRIALAVAQERTNREIAGALGLSVRTVENHVARALAKLGVTRSEVGSVLLDR